MNTTHLPLPLRRGPARRLASGTTPITLEAAAVQELHAAAGRTLVVDAGCVWLTEPGDEDDHFLVAGDTHRITSTGRVLIEAHGGTPAHGRLIGEAPPAGLFAALRRAWRA